MSEADMHSGERSQPEGFIGKAEVARRIGKTVRTVDAWMKMGILPYCKPERSVLFRWADVEQHIIANYLVKQPRSNGRRSKNGQATVSQPGPSSRTA